ncbi:hypothetical protein, partial [Bacillus altitudinis]|uniref:hypothetical protein n=1 Tax=Bacillus altitudinis TaxID=293387 RepID=UPI001C92F5D6
FPRHTPINLAKPLQKPRLTFLGTSFHTLHPLEHPHLFYHLLDELNLPHPKPHTPHSKQQALAHPTTIPYPLLMPPAYVIRPISIIVLHTQP